MGQGGQVHRHQARVGALRARHSIIVRSANGEYCADEVIGLASANDRCWHFRDIARSGTNVCFRRKSGRIADITTMTGFDPEPT